MPMSPPPCCDYLYAKDYMYQALTEKGHLISRNQGGLRGAYPLSGHNLPAWQR